MTNKEQTISNLKKLKSFHNGSYGADIDRAIEALEQDIVPFDFELYQAGLMEMPKEMIEVLNKIRAEIEALSKTYPFVNHFDMYVKEDDVKKIIDKYKAERSDKCSKCEYHINPDYTRCKECGAESEDK